MSDYKIDVGRGCCFRNGADEESASAKERVGCHKLSSTDWMEDIASYTNKSDIFEVRFKNTRKGYYRNVNDLPLKKGDIVAVESSPGHDIGIISLTGDMVKLQMKKSRFNSDNFEFKKIYRKAKPYDIVRWQEAIALEHSTMIGSRQIASDLRLNMKIGDVEYQGDRIKAIFYYIADERVDFRELIKILADRFKIRVEMKQIGARQEAGRIGGIASCGREMCCSTWVSSFVSVTTNSARFQEISLNPQKLAGQCGKLKCCLNYEVDAYIDARKSMPKVNAPLETMDGQYFLVKTDILAGMMSFSSDPHSMVNVITIDSERVREVIKLNRRGVKVESIKRKEQQVLDAAASNEPGFKNVVGEESITRFDNTAPKRRKNKNRNSGSKGDGNQERRSKEGQERKPREGQERKPKDGQERKPRDGQERKPREAQERRPERKPREAQASGEGASSQQPQQGSSDQQPRKRRYNNRRPQQGGAKPNKSNN